ncbi:MAG TPA: hypothetical protein VNI52_04095 [Sphingobacteriaceae bacterium]|nr:hypothetical protein [Sphingobacteriaceae bacterium]
MDLIPYLIDLFKYIIAGLIVFFVAWGIIKTYVDRIYNLQNDSLKRVAQTHVLPLRLQAHERLVMFLERINPAAMLIRLHVPGINAREMQNIILADIRAEYQHNITQQLYVSNQAWGIVKKIKEDTISMVNMAAHSLPGEQSGKELSKTILNHLASMEDENPYDVALILIKRDIHKLF